MEITFIVIWQPDNFIKRLHKPIEVVPDMLMCRRIDSEIVKVIQVILCWGEWRACMEKIIKKPFAVRYFIYPVFQLFIIDFCWDLHHLFFQFQPNRIPIPTNLVCENIASESAVLVCISIMVQIAQERFHLLDIENF